MGWADNAIWWHVYPLGFSGAPIREAGSSPAPRLQRLIPWLDYLIEMGASGLLLGPIFASQTHGYDTTDHFRIDPRLGSEQDFNDLISACKKRGIRVILDGVFSHVGNEHPEVLTVISDGPNSPKADLFDIDWNGPDGPAPQVFEGHSSLVRLNHDSEEAVRFAVSVMEHWMKRGIDGWRLDAAYSVPTKYWSQVISKVKAHFPDSWFLGEVIHGDYAQFTKEAKVDSVTQYELWKAIWSSIKDRNFFELDWALQRHNDFIRSFTPNTFIGNHDVTRIASQVGSNGAQIALAILLTIGGIPSIYYGDEQGFTGIKEERVGGDDDVRPRFPDSPSDLAPWGEPIFRSHQALISIRRQHPWLVSGTTTPLYTEAARYVYQTTSKDSLNHLTVEIDLDASPTVIIKNSDGCNIWVGI